MKPSLMYRHHTNSHKQLKKEISEAKSKKKIFGSSVGGILAMLGFVVVMGADADTPLNLVIACLIGFTLMGVGGVLVIRSNRK